MKHLVHKLLFITLFQIVSSALYAAETGYQVELIIFEDSTARYLNSEDWSYNDMLNNKQDLQEKKPQVKADPEYKELNWDEAKLATKLEKLKNNSNYKILLTKRWKQTGLDRKQAFNIAIDTRIKNSIKTAEETNTELDISPEENPAIEPYATGNVKLIMSRYLHFNVDLQYIRPQQTETGDIKLNTFPVVNERRMRSKEIHYIDHPLVGVIVLATPYKIKTPETNTGATTYKTM